MSNWMNEDITRFIIAHKLPAYVDKDHIVVNYIEDYRVKYLQDFDTMLQQHENRGFPESVYFSIEKIRGRIDATFQSIILILQNYEFAEMTKVQQEIDLMMHTLIPHLIVSGFFYHSNKPHRLFRVRISDKKLEERHELFHIPNTKRYLVGNERYSLAGSPCLYLSTSLGIAWEECRMPKNYCFSEFKFIGDIKSSNWRFITFLSPYEFATNTMLRVERENLEKQTIRICNYLITFPLIFACSIVNRWSDSSFKEEYVFPQLLLQWVRRNSSDIRGINYFSCVGTTEMLQWSGHNIVIPTKNYNSDGLDKELAEVFFLATPEFRELKIKNEDIEELKILEKKISEAISDSYYECHDLLILMHESCNLLISVCQDIEATPLTRKRALRVLSLAVTEAVITEKVTSTKQRCLELHSNEGDKLNIQMRQLEELCNDYKSLANRRNMFWDKIFGGDDHNAQDFVHI